MNGPHDLGGQMGFGPVAPDPLEPKFHAEWERRALGVTLATGAMGAWNIDESRHMRESLHPALYYNSSYYEIWIRALERLLERHGFVSADERAAGHGIWPGVKPLRVPNAADVPGVLARGAPCDRPVKAAPKFEPGQQVRMINEHPTGHTRLPRYARGKLGVIEAVRGGYVFPDTNAHAKGENPEHLYTVVFDGRELWGKRGDPALSVSVDAWESYVEPA